jgi:hypothetical protein
MYLISMFCHQQSFQLFRQEYLEYFSRLWYLAVGLYATGGLRLQNYHFKIFYSFSHILSQSCSLLQHPSLAAASSSSQSPRGAARVPCTAPHRAGAFPALCCTARACSLCCAGNARALPAMSAPIPCACARVPAFF